MSVAVKVSDELAARLSAEASRRGLSIEAVAGEVLSRNLPAPGGHRLRFVGFGASGKTEPLNLADERDELAARTLAEGI